MFCKQTISIILKNWRVSIIGGYGALHMQRLKSPVCSCASMLNINDRSWVQFHVSLKSQIIAEQNLL